MTKKIFSNKDNKTYIFTVPLFKTISNACCGQPHLYLCNRMWKNGDFTIDIGMSDEDDMDYYDVIYCNNQEEWEMIAKECINFLHDFEYANFDNAYNFYNEYLKPFINTFK